MRSRFLIELTTPEIEDYISKGGKAAFLPVGSVEMHGPHQPVGTDTLIAKAVCLRLAETVDGLVLPEISYTWTGATSGFAGTIDIEPELVQKTVETVALRSISMGFQHFAAVSVHGTNYCTLYQFARQFYEKHGFPVIYIDPYNGFSEQIKGIFAGKYAKSKEASLVLASLDILGIQNLYSEKDMSYEDEAPPLHDSLNNVSQAGIVGRLYQDIRQHACPSKYVSSEKGLEFIAKQVQYLSPILEKMDEYIKDSKCQKNKGWWRISDQAESKQDL